MSVEQLQSFQEISGCADVNEARHYLQSCNGDLERAINLFFSQATRRKVVSSGSFTSVATSRPRNNTASDVSIIELSDDEDRHNEDNVRAPIAPVQGPIVEQSFQQTYGSRRGPSNPIFEQCRDFRELAEQQDNNLRRRIAHNSRATTTANGIGRGLEYAEDDGPATSSSSSAGLRRGLNGIASTNQPSSNGLHRSNTGARNGDASRNATARAAKDLKTLFRPPLELMCQKEWDQAVIYTRQKKRWLLVNVQKAAEFACQVLNRDIWSESTVREIIQENFVFWQTYHDSPCGIRVSGYYELHDFPAIFIIDPRTGEEVKKLRAPDAVSFLDQCALLGYSLSNLTGFLDSYPTFEARDAEICGRPLSGTNGMAEADRQVAQPSSSEETGSSYSRCRKRKSHSEENNGDAAVVDSDANVQAKRMRRVVNICDDMDEMIVDESPMTSMEATNNSTPIVSPDEWQNHVGKASGKSKSLQLLLKLPNGDKEKLSLPDTTKLKALFLFIAGRQLSPNDHHFVLSFPKRVFNIHFQEQTLAAVGFATQEVVHVERI